MENISKRKKELNAFDLKVIAIVCMLVDHIAWLFVEQESMLSLGMHIIGRITFPIMCFFIAEGYRHTSNLNKYLLRLGIFALISAPAYYFSFGTFKNVYITLFLGLLSLAISKKTQSSELKLIVVCVCSMLSYFGDWSLVGVPMIYLFGVIEDKTKRIVYSIGTFIGLYTLSKIVDYFTSGTFSLTYFAIVGAFIAGALLFFYNGKRGNNSFFAKYMFYIFYPAHLVILELIRRFVAG